MTFVSFIVALFFFVYLYVVRCLVLLLFLYVFFVFFKHKTAYEVRISDWSSDVCSSDLADAELSAARRRRLPTLSLVADYGLSSNTPGTNDEDTYRYGATLELPIYAGGAIKAQENAARHQLEQQRIQLDDLRQQIEQDVRLAVAPPANTREHVRAALSARALAEPALELARAPLTHGGADNHA